MGRVAREKRAVVLDEADAMRLGRAEGERVRKKPVTRNSSCTIRTFTAVILTKVLYESIYDRLLILSPDHPHQQGTILLAQTGGLEKFSVQKAALDRTYGPIPWDVTSWKRSHVRDEMAVLYGDSQCSVLAGSFLGEASSHETISERPYSNDSCNLYCSLGACTDMASRQKASSCAT